MSLGRILALFKEHPYWSCFITIFLIYLFGEYYPYYFEQLKLENHTYYIAMLFVGLFLFTGYGHKGENKPKYKQDIKQEDNHGEELE